MMRRDTLDERFGLAVQAWDLHLAHCTECLSRGRHFCDEGVYLAYDLSRVRMEIESFESREMHRLESAQRRLGLPGMPA